MSEPFSGPYIALEGPGPPAKNACVFLPVSVVKVKMFCAFGAIIALSFTILSTRWPTYSYHIKKFLHHYLMVWISGPPGTCQSLAQKFTPLQTKLEKLKSVPRPPWQPLWVYSIVYYRNYIKGKGPGANPQPQGLAWLSAALLECFRNCIFYWFSSISGILGAFEWNWNVKELLRFFFLLQCGFIFCY